MNIYNSRLTPLNMPDYAEVANGCSTFKAADNGAATSPLYDSCGAYATTNLVKNANLFAAGNYNYDEADVPIVVAKNAASNAAAAAERQQQSFAAGLYANKQQHHSQQHHSNHHHNNTSKSATNSPRMNIVENKLDAINNLNRSLSTASVPYEQSQQPHHLQHHNQHHNPHQQHQHHHHQANHNHPHQQPYGVASAGTIRRGQRLPKIGYSDKLSFGELGRSAEHQPLYVKSKEDGSWSTVTTHNATYQFAPMSGGVAELTAAAAGSVSGSGSGSIADCSSTTQLNAKGGHFGNNLSNTSPIYMSSFGRADKV